MRDAFLLLRRSLSNQREEKGTMSSNSNVAAVEAEEREAATLLSTLQDSFEQITWNAQEKAHIVDSFAQAAREAGSSSSSTPFVTRFHASFAAREPRPTGPHNLIFDLFALLFADSPVGTATPAADPEQQEEQQQQCRQYQERYTRVLEALRRCKFPGYRPGPVLAPARDRRARLSQATPMDVDDAVEWLDGK